MGARSLSAIEKTWRLLSPSRFPSDETIEAVERALSDLPESEVAAALEWFAGHAERMPKPVEIRARVMTARREADADVEKLCPICHLPITRANPERDVVCASCVQASKNSVPEMRILLLEGIKRARARAAVE